MNLEIILISAVILLQFYVFITTRKSIKILEGIFPSASQLKIKNVQLDENVASRISKEELSIIIQNNKEQTIEAVAIEESLEATYIRPKLLNLDLIKTSGRQSAIFKKVINSTNTYLLRNKNHAADFKIIREIAEREVDAQENQVETTINLPLFLGLLGTIAGIVFGLWELAPVGSFLSGNGDISSLANNIEEKIPQLLGAVSFAMIASFVGLGLTIFSNGSLYKRAIRQCDNNKNDYFTFIQTELLPILARDMNSSLFSLQANLNQFNSSFNENLQKFTKSVKGVQENLRLQSDFLDKLDRIGYDQIVNTNAALFDKLQKSAKELGSFVDYQKELNGTIQTGRNMTEQLAYLILKVKNFEENANETFTHISSVFEKNETMFNFLESSMGEIKVRENAMNNLVTNLDNTFQKSVELLNNRALNEYQEFRSITSEELNMIQKSYERSRPQFQQLENLTEIKKQLEQMNLNLAKNLAKQDKTKPSKNGIERSDKEVVSALHQLNFNMEKFLAQQGKKKNKSFKAWLINLFIKENKKEKEEIKSIPTNNPLISTFPENNHEDHE